MFNTTPNYVFLFLTTIKFSTPHWQATHVSNSQGYSSFHSLKCPKWTMWNSSYSWTAYL